MTVTPGQLGVIIRLRQGQLETDDYRQAGVASREVLKVLIHQLRAKGYEIKTVNADGIPRGPGVRRNIKAFYRLVSEPTDGA